ncbi:MAG: hypothetical protein IPG45_35320 [Deltaproteobacteria bacterium]|nr:hypothetical protein [Deltaproteobacteria bacterium]
MFAAALFVTLLGAPGPVVVGPGEAFGVQGAIALKSLQVLDFDAKRGLLALKVRTTALPYHDASSEDSSDVAPADCGYAGFQKTPYDGVTLLLWDLERKNVEEWVIYRATHNAKDCTAPAVSKKNLAEAKAALEKAKLKSTGEAPAEPVERLEALRLPLGERKVALTFAQQEVEICDGERAPTEVWEKEARREACQGPTSAMNQAVTLLVNIDKRPAYLRWDTYETGYGRSAEFSVVQFASSGSKVVLIEQLRLNGGMAGEAEGAWRLSCSPILELGP